MDSRLQKLAVEQMSRMTPEQLAQIRNQMGDISPAGMERMRRHMSTMTPADLERIEKKMQNTDPSTLPSVSSTVQARQAHAYQVSMSLKKEGNQFFMGGNYMKAVEKYERAKENLNVFLDKQSSELMAICALNTANCYLKLEMYTPCIKECSEVLKESRKNVKALYRRGQAYMHQKKYPEALADLKEAYRLTKGDPKEQSPIQEKLKEVEQQLRTAPASSSSPAGEVEEIPIEEIPSPEPRGKEAKELREAAEKFSNMSDEEIRQLNQVSGLDVKPEDLRIAYDALKDVDSDTLRQMASLAEKLQAGEAAKGSGAPPSFELNSDRMEHISGMFEANPDLVKTQAEQLKHMSQKELDQLAAMTGMKLTPELAKKTAETISHMSAEQLKDLPKMAHRTQTKMQSPTAGSSSSPAQSAAPDASNVGMSMTPDMMETARKMMETMSVDDINSMQQMMANGDASGTGAMPSNPDMIRRMTQMMHSMDEETLVQMIGTSGMCRDESQARLVVRQMKGMSPSQMERLAKAASYAQRGSEVFKKVKTWLRSQTALLLAILIIVIGVVLRYFGVM